MKVIAKTLIAFFLGFSLLVAAAVMALYIATPLLGEKKLEIERFASETLHQPIKIESSKGVWFDTHPGVFLKNVTIYDEKGIRPLLTIPEIQIGFKILRSLWFKKPVLAHFYLRGAHFTLYQDANNHIKIAELPTLEDNSQSFNASELLNYISSFNKIKLEQISIDWQKPNGHWIKIPDFKIKFKNNWYEQKGSLTLKQTELGELLTEYSFKEWRILKGKINTLNFQWIIRFQTLNYLKGSINAEQIHILQPNHITWSIPKLSSRFLWQGKINDQWSLKLQKLQLNLDGNEWSEKLVQASVAPIKHVGWLYTFRASQIQLSQFWVLLNKLQLLPQTGYASHLVKHINPNGDLKNIYLEYPDYSQAQTNLEDKFEDKPTISWKFSTEVHHLSTAAWNKIPGIEELTGYLQMSNNLGQFRLDSENLKFNLPTLFRTPLSFQHAQANIDWQLLPTGYKINTPNLEVDNSDLKFKGDMSLWLPDKGSSFVHLFGEYKINPNAKIYSYLPVALMKPSLIKWLDQAFVTIGSGHGTLVLRGPLDQFPFPHQEGIFASHTKLDDVNFSYMPHWPMLKKVVGRLHFDGPKMSVALESGKIFDTKIKSAFVEIPMLLKNVEASLQARMALTGDLRDAFHFIQQSPLNKQLGAGLDQIKFNGDSQINLKLDIPLENDHAPTQVRGKIDMAEARAVLAFKQLAFENITGILHFTQDGLFANNIQAEFLHSPVTLNIESQKDIPKAFQVATKRERCRGAECTNEYMSTEASSQQSRSLKGEGYSRTNFKLKGTAHIRDIQKTLDLPRTPYITGSFAYHANLAISHSLNPNPHKLTLTSDLQGVKINLPTPLNKTSNHIAHSHIDLTFAKNHPINIQFNYDNFLKGLLDYTPENFTFKKGHIVLGEGEVKLPENEDGLWVTGTLPRFDQTAWINFFHDSQSKAHADKSKKMNTPWPAFLKKIRLSFKNIQLLDQNFQNILLELSRAPDHWILGVSANYAVGKIHIPDNKDDLWTARFQKLYLPKNPNQTKQDIKPSDIPHLDFFAENFQYGGKLFGKTRLVLEPTHDGLNIQQLSAETPAFSLNTHGQWRATKLSNYTNFVGQIQLRNVGETLVSFKLPASIAGKDSKLAFNLEWPGVPYDPLFKQLSGKIDIALNNGRITDLGEETTRKIGLGQLLNFFSLQNLPRRLSLDFSDVTKQGFTFDKMRGSFSLKNGEAYTNNTYVEGVVAHISMQGHISLANENYDVFLYVTPYLTSSLPIVATIAGGPVLGLTTWVADKLFSKEVAKLMTYSYHMHGPWSNPNVASVAEKEHEPRVPLQKSVES